VVLGFNDLNNPNWRQLLYKQLEQGYRQHVTETGYTMPQGQQPYGKQL
jgi:hypothetical protein